MEIWAVVKDPGGTSGILPVVAALRAKRREVLLIANGKAVELLKGKIEHVVCENAAELLENHSLPRVLMTSMCSGGGVGRDLVSLLRGKAQTVAVQDFWGSRLWTDWSDPQYRPDFTTVNDSVGASIVFDAWRDYSDLKVVQTGFPALDKYFGVDVAGARQKVRATLGLDNDTPIVLFGGQGEHTGHSLEELVESLNCLRKNVYLIARPHPRTKDNFKSEMAPWQKALVKLCRGTLVVDFFNQIDQPLSFIAAADVVVSMYSTMLIEAAALRKPNISMLYPEYGMAAFYNTTGGGMREFPLVSLGCSAKATNQSDLRMHLWRAIRSLSPVDNCLIGGRLGLQSAQEEHFKLDGGNAKRVADLVEGLL